MTTFVLSVFNAGLVSNTRPEAVVLPLALFYGGVAQFMAGMWEFRKGNTFGALAFSSFAAFWLSFAAYVKFVEPGLGATAATATGLYLLAWTIFTAYMTVAAARVNGAVLGVFVFLTLTFLFLTIAELAAAPGIAKVGGWLGLVTAVVAWYASFAAVTNFTWKRTVLPLFPLSPARHH
jgi:succinate-acetate transporter protein